MKTASITSSRIRPYGPGRDGRPISNGFNVFVESNTTKCVDSFFNENKIWALDYKCKTWSKLGSLNTKETIKSLRELFGDDCEIKYSLYAGCSMCPCSPGYRVRKSFNSNKEHHNHDVWVKIEADLTELQAKLPKFQEMLNKEIESHKA